jgi:hypothetical protein
VAKFRKKPVVIEAVRFTGENVDEVRVFLGEIGVSELESMPPIFVIPTLEGDMQARPGDWIIKGVAGEFYPCKDRIFRQTYEPAE